MTETDSEHAAGPHVAVKSPNVGLIGVGAMGRGFAKNLVEAGFTVRGFDLRPESLEELNRVGGEPVDSPVEAVQGARWILTSLPKAKDVREVLLGTGGVSTAANPGTIVIDTSTSLPQEAIGLAQALQGHQLNFVDASISGTGTTVLSKDITVLAGGSDQDFHAASPVFNAIAQRTYHLGPVGTGALAKLLVNVVVVGNRLALAESLALGIKAGMDPELLLQILKDGASYSRAMDLKGEKMIKGDYRPESTLSQSLAGTQLLLAEAQRVGSPLFGVAVYSQVVQAAVAQGLGELDPAALLEALLTMGGSHHHE